MTFFLNVLTRKGLDYVLANNPEPDVRDAVRKELKRRRSVSQNHIVAKSETIRRDVDGYERDR